MPTHASAVANSRLQVKRFVSAPMQNIVAVQGLDPEAQLDEEDPRHVLWHALPLLLQYF